MCAWCMGQVVLVYIEECTGTGSLTQSKYRQTNRQTGAYSAVLPVGFPSPCPASETPSASAPPRLRDTCDGSPSAERGQREGGGEEERGRRGRSEGGEGGGRVKEEGEPEYRSSVLTCFSRR